MDGAGLVKIKKLQIKLYHVTVDVFCLWDDSVFRAGVPVGFAYAFFVTGAFICYMYFYRRVYNWQLAKAHGGLPLGLQRGKISCKGLNPLGLPARLGCGGAGI